MLRTIQEHSGVGNPQETADAASHKRDSSKAITAWKARLTPGGGRRIRDATEPISSAFYADVDW